jgi:hypothetical protein
MPFLKEEKAFGWHTCCDRESQRVCVFTVMTCCHMRLITDLQVTAILVIANGSKYPCRAQRLKHQGVKEAPVFNCHF